ncbi:hypothetical protein HOLleu_02365 [Holothuria leucospilota]|uniref:Uncharacterized protein n=1 Tax=Holothuria leucospilota TaxID=206669 RepID=A0A9Q1HLD9_HOLLE|nr:hypothetical protein HOLleu_02365 [Holothuria leucospilota]
MTSKKASKDPVKKSPQVAKLKASSNFSPPTLRHRTYSDVPLHTSQEQSIRDLQASMDLAFQKVYEKVDSILLNQEEIKERITSLERTQRDLEQSTSFLSTTVDELQARQTKMDADTDQLRKDMDEFLISQKAIQNSNEETLKSISEAQQKAERYSRSFNLRFGGIEEKQNEDAISEIKKVLSKYFNMNDVTIENAHRIGKHQAGKSRHIIAKFLFRPERQSILTKARRSLEGTGYFITEDMTPEDYRKKSKLRPIMNAAFLEGKRPRFRNGQLYINGNLYVESRPNVPTRE